MELPGFEQYFDERFSPLGEYFTVHRDRFIKSWEFLNEKKAWHGGTVLDIGGIGPLSGYIRDCCTGIAVETKTDLREPLNIATGSCDLVICTETIEHIKDCESDQIEDLEWFNFSGVDYMLRELYRVCSESGRVFITTPNANSFITLHKWVHGESLYMDPAHVREFSVNDLREHVESSGFVVEELITLNTWGRTFGRAVEGVISALAHVLEDSGVQRGDNIFALLRKKV
jgi:hypothetical protein